MEKWKRGKTVYFHNSVNTTDAIFKLDAEGNMWSKFRNGIEAMTPESRSAWDSYILCFCSATKEQYDNFENSLIPNHEDWGYNIFMCHVPVEVKDL